MWLNPQETADLFIFTEEILSGKVHLLCIVRYFFDLTSLSGLLTYRSTPCELRPAVEEANFRNDYWFLMKILFV